MWEDRPFAWNKKADTEAEATSWVPELPEELAYPWVRSGPGSATDPGDLLEHSSSRTFFE